MSQGTNQTTGSPSRESTAVDQPETLERTNTIHTIGFLKLRGKSDDLPQRWWFASTAIPLIAATIGPLCNVLSIAALVTPWRVTLADNGQLPTGTDDSGVGIKDPTWEIALNAISLVCGFAGNFFLLLNFVGRVRYILALPLSVIFWTLSSVVLIAITSALHAYDAPIGPGQIYSQGFWHAVLAAILYFVGALILGINLAGYLRGHFSQQFDLDNDQRTLILQTMGFFFWLAGGAGIFCAIEGFTFTNALYYADISVLTIGFGDFYPTTDAGRGFLFVFELLGVIQLGLVISSITRFVSNMTADKIVKTHQRHARESTVGRAVTSEKELRERLGLPPRQHSRAPDGHHHPSALGSDLNQGPRRRSSISQYGKLEIVGRTVKFHEKKAGITAGGRGVGRTSSFGKKPLNRDGRTGHKNSSTQKGRRYQRRQKLLLLQEEKDRFEAMREIQDETRRFKQYYALALSVLAFAGLWCFGALVFMLTEERILGLSYFDSLYFCFVSLLTIGYGDFSPKSNIGKPFFIVWSIIAVPTMTVLIQEMSNTVIAAINNWTFTIADFTVLPKKGIFKLILNRNPWLIRFIKRKQEEKRMRDGFQLQNPDDIYLGRIASDRTAVREEEENAAQDVQSEEVCKVSQAEDTEHDLAQQVAQAIKSVVQDLRADSPRRYSFEEWVYFKKLIQFSRNDQGDHCSQKPIPEDGLDEDDDEDNKELVDWDWIGEDSPMLADITEAEWVLDRLCESLNRYTKQKAKLMQCAVL